MKGVLTELPQSPNPNQTPRNIPCPSYSHPRNQQSSWTMSPPLVEPHCSGVVPTSLQANWPPTPKIHSAAQPLIPEHTPCGQLSSLTPGDYTGTGTDHSSCMNRHRHKTHQLEKIKVNTQVRIHSTIKSTI